jgi:hypothetical protein
VVVVVCVEYCTFCPGTAVHVVVTKLFAAEAVAATHPRIGVTGAVTTGAGQVVVSQLFAADAVIGEHDATGVGPVVAEEQVETTQLLPAVPDEVVQVWTGVGGVVTVLQVVLVKLLAALGVAALHVPVCTGVGPV